MCSFYDGLSLWVIRDTYAMFYMKPCTKVLKRFRSVSRGVVSFKTLGQHKSNSEGLFLVETE